MKRIATALCLVLLSVGCGDAVTTPISPGPVQKFDAAPEPAEEYALSGVVYETGSGDARPVAGATVVVGHNPAHPELSVTVTTDGAGRFYFSGPTGNYEVVVTMAGYQGTEASVSLNGNQFLELWLTRQ
jgi:hypothetical protein